MAHRMAASASAVWPALEYPCTQHGGSGFRVQAGHLRRLLNMEAQSGPALNWTCRAHSFGGRCGERPLHWWSALPRGGLAGQHFVGETGRLSYSNVPAVCTTRHIPYRLQSAQGGNLKGCCNYQGARCFTAVDMACPSPPRGNSDRAAQAAVTCRPVRASSV